MHNSQTWVEQVQSSNGKLLGESANLHVIKIALFNFNLNLEIEEVCMGWRLDMNNEPIWHEPLFSVWCETVKVTSRRDNRVSRSESRPFTSRLSSAHHYWDLGPSTWVGILNWSLYYSLKAIAHKRAAGESLEVVPFVVTLFTSKPKNRPREAFLLF